MTERPRPPRPAPDYSGATLRRPFIGGRLRRPYEELHAENQRLKATLGRAAYVAEHLMQMIARETWRAHGADDGQGHYEGDYRAEQTAGEIEEWARIAEDAA